MAEVLSQSQIDALLNSMQDDTGDKTEKKAVKKEQNYRKYDFYSPKKFTKDKIRVIKGIYDNYSRIASSQLNSILRMNCEMDVISVEEQRYNEFSNALNENDIMMQASLSFPDDSKYPPMLFYINQLLMINMIDRMLGGEGGEEELDSSYSYTEIELSLYQNIMHYIISVTKDAWSNYISIDVNKLRLEENPSLFQEISMDETVAIVIINVNMQSVEGTIRICIPGNMLTGIFSIMEKRKNVEGAYDNGIENARDIIHSSLRESTLMVKAQLAQASVSLSDIYNLKVGDVLDLNKPKDDTVLLYVEEQPWFEGNLGAYKRNVAIKIDKRFGQEND